MYFINQQPKYQHTKFQSMIARADIFIDAEKDVSTCGHCAKEFHGHMHQLAAIIHIANHHQGNKN